MSLLTDLFKKRKIDNVNELSEEEKAVYDSWEKVLSKEEMTLEDVKNFCKTQCEVIEGKWFDLNLTTEKKSEFIAYHVVYKAILKAIDSPRIAREALEVQLRELLK